MPRATCDHCQRPLPVCYCHLLPDLGNRVPVTILQHRLEQFHAVNTARIAALSLRNCRMLECGDAPDDSWLQQQFPQARPPALIYPRRDVPCQPLHALPADSELLFIDANWRKSRRLLLHSPWLRSLPCYSLEDLPPSRYRIRKAALAGQLSTLEAIVHVLTALGEPQSSAMLGVMDWMVERQLEFLRKNRSAG